MIKVGERPPVPDFLVIGAMKSGTTTLYEDLRRHPSIRMLEKESAVLSGPFEGAPPPDNPSATYAKLIGQRDDRLVGEVSTTYAMAPYFPGVPECAGRSLPKTTRVIYIVREPVARIISHHHHDLSSGRITTDIDDAVRADSRLVDYTRYASQVRPWIDVFGRERVLILKFEEYVKNRHEGLAQVSRFLRLDPGDLSPEDQYVVHNASDGKPLARGRWGRVVRSPVYRRIVRPLVPEGARRRLMHSVLPKATARPTLPRADTVAFIRERLAEDRSAFATIVGGEWWRDGPLDRPSGSGKDSTPAK